jgi:hypothetical protein
MSARTSLSPTVLHPRPFDGRLTFQLHTEFGEELFASLEIVDNDQNVVHPLMATSECPGFPAPGDRWSRTGCGSSEGTSGFGLS